MNENKIGNMANLLEQSVEDCNKHYSGMIQVYEIFLALLEEKTDLNLLEKNFKEALPKIKQPDPTGRGISDGKKIIERILEDLKDDNQSINEIKIHIKILLHSEHFYFWTIFYCTDNSENRIIMAFYFI